MNEYNALERQVGLLILRGTQAATIHTAMFMQLLAAQQAGDDKLAKFYAERFPADVRKLTTHGSRRGFSKIRTRTRTRSCRIPTRRGAPARLPRQARGLRGACRNPAVPGMFPVNISRIPCSLPCFSSLPAPRGSSSSVACVWSRSLSLRPS